MLFSLAFYRPVLVNEFVIIARLSSEIVFSIAALSSAEGLGSLDCDVSMLTLDIERMGGPEGLIY